MAACPKAIQTHTNPIPNWETAYADHPHKISPDKNRPAKFAVTKSGLQGHQPSLCRQEAAYSKPGAKITVSFSVKAACISRPNDQPPLKPIESGFKKNSISHNPFRKFRPLPTSLQPGCLSPHYSIRTSHRPFSYIISECVPSFRNNHGFCLTVYAFG